MNLSLARVINISVSEAQPGVGELNTSNVVIFSDEPFADSFGDLGYNIYLSPDQAATDFGTASKTFQMVNAIFAQQPNVLAGGGYVVVIPFVTATQTLTFSSAAASGTFIATYGGNATAAINWNDTAAQVQAKMRAAGWGDQVTVTGTIAGELLTVAFGYGNGTVISISSNSLENSGSVAVTVVGAITHTGEDLATAITRTKGLVQYFGILETVIVDQVDMLAAAAVVQAIVKMAFFVSRTEADVEPGGRLDMLTTGAFDRSRGLYYGGATDLSALLMAAAYVGRGLSVDFEGSNTTLTMHLKTLQTIQPDPSMDESILTLCVNAGADVYASFEGVPKVFTSGANRFFDQVYNELAWVSGLQVAGFNYLAGAATKIPQTETGMDGLKGAYRQVNEQYVTNQYLAPGQWNSGTTFGNQADFLANISQRGYYIYSVPIAQQQQAVRAQRKAPLCQIAGKEAGAIQESDVIVYINP